MPKKMLERAFIGKSVYDIAIERINHTYDLFDHVCVSFSGGKDSTVCLNLAYEVAKERGRLPLRVIFFDEEAIALQTVDYVRRVAEHPDIDLEWYCLPVKCRNACSHKQPNWYPWAPEDRDKWVRELPPEAITELDGFPTDPEKRLSLPETNNLLVPAEKYGTSGMILGIRTQESLVRYRAVVRRVKDNYIVGVGKGSSWGQAKSAQGNSYKVYPIYDWRTEDGWTQPIVVREGSFEIVDGFHRWTVAGDPEVKTMTKGRVPCVFLKEDAGRGDQMLSTVRHNRARGVHHVLKMASIVRELIDKQGMSDEEVGVRLGMDDEEVERLYDSSGMTERGSSKAFSEAWAPKEGGSKG